MAESQDFSLPADCSLKEFVTKATELAELMDAQADGVEICLVIAAAGLIFRGLCPSSAATCLSIGTPDAISLAHRFLALSKELEDALNLIPEVRCTGDMKAQRAEMIRERDWATTPKQFSSLLDKLFNPGEDDESKGNAKT